MSSTYRILCLSHDPALKTDIEWSAGTDNTAAAARAAATAVVGHDGCDILVGRYSYPLLDVACSCGKHAGVEWIDVDWLRLLALAQGAPAGSPLREIADKASRSWCWTPERLHRLRYELFPDQAP